MECSRCDKEMERYDGGCDIATKISIATGTAPSLMEIEYAKKQLGKYYKPNVEYNFCVECWIDSLMGVRND